MSERPTLTFDEAVARLAVHEHRCEECGRQMDEDGAVTTPHDLHGPRRRTVHSYSVGGMVLGADWDEAGVHEFLREADKIVDTGGWMGHGVAARGKPDGDRALRWYAFDTNEDAR